MSSYIEVKIEVQEELQETVIALLSDENFDSFNQEDNQVLAYISTEFFSEKYLKEILESEFITGLIGDYSYAEMENINWNKKWEENFDPVYVNEQMVIKASFHKLEKSYPLEIIINPKMSFGTGHHATTKLMSKAVLDLDMKGKTVFDAGTGTGVLAILAEKRGAIKIDTNDIDEWAFENAPENFQTNNCNNIKIENGIFQKCVTKQDKYDVILANINKNVLLEEVPHYANHLIENGYLVISGFYVSDEEDLISLAQKNHLILVKEQSENNWASIVFQKK